MRWLPLFLFLATRCCGAIGDIAWVTILPDGWSAQVEVSGIGTNSTFYNAFGTNNSVGASNTFRIDLTSMGFDDGGNGAQISRSVFGTKIVRRVYPNEQTNDITLDASIATNSIFRVALSDFIYQRDSNLVATITAGAFATTNAVTNCNAISGLAVTNNSAQPYPTVVGNWSWPGYQLLTNSTFYVRALAFHRHGQQGRPVRTVRFVAQDTNGIASTNFQTTMQVDRSIGDAVPVTEYIGQLSCASMSNGSPVRCDFTAYPWIGDSTLSTFDNVNFCPSGNYCSITNICDRLGSYGISYAVVSTTNNSGSAGVVTTNFNSGSPPLAFDTIAHAYSAMASSNNTWFGRNDCGAGVIYLREGNHAWTGAGTPSGNIPNVWVTYTAFPGTLRTNAQIGSQSANNICKGRELFQNLWLSNSAAILVYSATASHSAWVDQCDINMTGGNALDTRAYYVTRSSVFKFSQGFRVPAGDISMPALVRGNMIQQAGGINHLYTVIGNNRPDTAGVVPSFDFMVDSATSLSAPAPSMPIMAYNKVMSCANVLGLALKYLSNSITGEAIVQNVFEVVTNTSYAISGVEADNRFATNLIIWNNTWVGQRINYAYNSAGDSNPPMYLHSLKNNAADSCANKSDTFTTGNAARTNNWPVVFGVGQAGNYIIGISNVGTTSFPFEFSGLNSYQPALSASNPKNAQKYVGISAYDGASPAVGNGNYRLQSSSPFFGISSDVLLPFDIEGVPRGRSDPPGAYASGNVKKGFF